MHWGTGSRSGNGSTDSLAVGGKGKKRKRMDGVVNDEEAIRLELSGRERSEWKVRECAKEEGKKGRLTAHSWRAGGQARRVGGGLRYLYSM